MDTRGRLNIIGDLFTGADRLGDPDDLDLLGYRPVEERSQAEADEDGEQNTNTPITVRFLRKLIQGITSSF